MNPGDYPSMPSTGAEKTFDLEPAEVRRIIDTTLFAVAQDDKRPAHTGELFCITPDKLTVVALDGFRLAIVEKKIEATKDINIIIPQKTLAEVTRLMGEEEQEGDMVHIAANRRFVVFSSRRYTITSRLIEGDFLDLSLIHI